MKTELHSFKRGGMKGVFNLLTVTPNIPAADALQSSSDLLSTIEDLIEDAAMGNRALEHNSAWLVQHTLETAKALLDSVIFGMDEKRPQPTAADLLTCLANILPSELCETDLVMLNNALAGVSAQVRNNLREKRDAR